VIDLIPEGKGDVPPRIVHLVVGFVKMFAPYMNGRLPTTRKNVNFCSCSGVTLTGIVKSGESLLDQERLYHKRGPMPSHA